VAHIIACTICIYPLIAHATWCIELATRRQLVNVQCKGQRPSSQITQDIGHRTNYTLHITLNNTQLGR